MKELFVDKLFTKLLKQRKAVKNRFNGLNCMDKMRTTIKYVVLKGDDYQLGTPLYEENLQAGSAYFDSIPAVVTFNGRDFRVKYKELTRKQTYDENDESQHILVKMIAMN